MLTKENNYCCQNQSSLSKTNQVIFEMIENIDSDYITFILGFISSIVINDFYSIFNTHVKEDILNFCFMLMECIGLTFVTIVLLNFTVGFSRMQKELLPHKTLEARKNFFQDKIVGVKTKKFTSRLIIICIVSLVVFALNVVKFICLNV